jgi:hypothetical protein
MNKNPLKNRPMFKPCDHPDCSAHVTFVLRTCETCHGTGHKERRCTQCWRWKKTIHFRGARGNFTLRCGVCSKKYANWEKKPLDEREQATNPRKNIPNDGPLRVSFVVRSGNRKTGPIPVSMTSARTCPRSCPLYGRGCYAEQHMVSMHWRRISKGKGLLWSTFISAVVALPAGQLWRHNEAGDLPGDDEEIDVNLFKQLLRANRGKRGFTYTHKPLTEQNVFLMLQANRLGFTVNASADSLSEADQKAALGLPVVVVLDHNAPTRGIRTPDGRHVVVCPAQTRDDVTCESCELCYVAKRKSIVGFLAHGDRKKQITERHRQLPMFKETPRLPPGTVGR